MPSKKRTAITEARGAPYLPELYVRLAELLSDEARYHYQVAFEREQRSNKNLHVPQVRFLKERAINIYRGYSGLSGHPSAPACCLIWVRSIENSEIMMRCERLLSGS